MKNYLRTHHREFYAISAILAVLFLWIGIAIAQNLASAGDPVAFLRIVLIGGSDGTNLRALKTDTNGNIVHSSDFTGVGPTAAPTSTQLVGGQFLSAAPTLTNGQVAANQMDASGRIKVLVTSTPTSSAANVNSTFASQALTTAAAVKGSVANFFGVQVYNPNASVCYLELFNIASGSVVLGTTVPVLNIGVPATNQVTIPVNGFGGVTNFSTALSAAATTAPQGASTCAVGMIVNLWYQ